MDRRSLTRNRIDRMEGLAHDGYGRGIAPPRAFLWTLGAQLAAHDGVTPRASARSP